MKISAADPRLLQHEGGAVVFEDIHDLAARVDDEALEVRRDSVMVLRNAGPVGAPGMPEWGHLPIPAKLLKQGVTDLAPHLRRTDERNLLRCRRAPCRARSRPSAAPWRSSRTVTGSVWTCRSVGSTWLVDEGELARRREAWQPPERKDERGYRRLYEDNVLQANEGCDFGFLRGRSPVVTDAVTYL